MMADEGSTIKVCTSDRRFISSPVRTQSKNPISWVLKTRNNRFLTRHITRSAAELNSLKSKADFRTLDTTKQACNVILQPLVSSPKGFASHAASQDELSFYIRNGSMVMNYLVR